MCVCQKVFRPFQFVYFLLLLPEIDIFAVCLRVIVLLEGEPSVKSEVLSALGQISISLWISLYHAPFCFTLTLTSLPVPSTVIHPSTMLLTPPGSNFEMMSDTVCPPDMIFRIQAKQFNFGFIRAETLISHSLKSWRCFSFLCKLRRGFQSGPRSVECHSDVSSGSFSLSP